MKKYEWNEETLDHFQFTSCYANKSTILKHVTNFVDLECQLEDGDIEEEMVESLMNAIYK